MSNVVTNTFAALYNASKETAKAAKQPFVLNKNKRALAAAIDSAEQSKIDAQEGLEKELTVVADGKVVDFNKVLAYKQTIADADKTVAALTEFETEFFATEA